MDRSLVHTQTKSIDRPVAVEDSRHRLPKSQRQKKKKKKRKKKEKSGSSGRERPTHPAPEGRWETTMLALVWLVSWTFAYLNRSSASSLDLTRRCLFFLLALKHGADIRGSMTPCTATVQLSVCLSHTLMHETNKLWQPSSKRFMKHSKSYHFASFFPLHLSASSSYSSPPLAPSFASDGSVSFV